MRALSPKFFGLVQLSPQVRFLLRGSGLFIVMLAIWWWVLLTPMLAGLRLTTEAVLWLMPGGRSASGVTVESDGDWTLRVPMPRALAQDDAVQRAYGRKPGAPPVNVRSFRLTIASRIPTFFMLSFPLYWALMLAAPLSRRTGRAAGIGTALLAALAQISLLVYTAYSIESTIHLAASAWAVTLWNAVEYMNVNVLPYLAPMLIAPWLHADLRRQIFSWTAEPVPEPAVRIPAEKPRRGKYRGK